MDTQGPNGPLLQGPMPEKFYPEEGSVVPEEFLRVAWEVKLEWQEVFELLGDD